MKTMKTMSILMILLFSLSLNAKKFESFTLDKKNDNIKSICELTFISSPGISFEGETISQMGYFLLNYNFPAGYKAPLYIQNILISDNLKDIPYSDIEVVFNNTIKIKLSDFVRGYVFLLNGNHSIHLEINKKRSSINAGTARLEFNLITNCI